MQNVAIVKDEYYEGHWVTVKNRSYYFPSGVSLEMAYNMLSHERQ